MGSIVVLEIDDLISHDSVTGNIVVDKSIFNCYVENSCIDIQLVGYSYDIVNTYKMVVEDDECIYMEFVG